MESVRMLGEAVDKWSLVAAEDLWNLESNVLAESSEDKEIRVSVCLYSFY